jgi:cell wall-associated NlpC family hydrolase
MPSASAGWQARSARWTRAVGTAAILAALSLTFAGTADAAPTPGSSTPSSSAPGATTTTISVPAQAQEMADQARATELADEIRADGQQLDQLSEQVDAAQIHAQQLDRQLATTKVAAAAASRQVISARAALTHEAIDAYTEGGGEAAAYALAPTPGNNPSVVAAYAGTVASAEVDALHTYRLAVRHQQSEETALNQQQDQQAAATAQLRSDEQAASAQEVVLQASLRQVQGSVAKDVALVQQQQQQAEVAQEMAALSAQGGLAPGGGPVFLAISGSGSATTVTQVPVAGSGSQLTSPPTTAPHPTTTTSTTVAPTTTTRAVPVSSSTTTAPAPGSSTTAAPTTTVAPETVPTTVKVAITTTTTLPGSNIALPAAPPVGWQVAIATAEAQIGKPYQWGGAGPNSYDCSGLVMVAWAAGGVQFPHLAQDQYDMTARLQISQLLPGDLVFFGTPDNVGHVGLYIGGGEMVDAPETGQNVQIQSIYWPDLIGGGRVV